jgi:hypothetical protein
VATCYSEADPTVTGIVAARIKAAHLDFDRHGVRVGVTMAYNPAGPGVKAGGYPAAAMVKVVPQKDRIRKLIDAEIIVDETVWEGLNPRQRVALIAHELAHLKLVKRLNKDTGMFDVVADDNGRPKLKTVPGDWNAGDGYRAIVAEFGDDAIEYDNLRRAWANADGAKRGGLDGLESGGLFAAAADIEAATPITVGAERSRPAADPEADADPQLWQMFPLARWAGLGATEGDVAKLADGRFKSSGIARPIETVGDLAAFSQDGNQLTDLKGLGAEAADRLSEAETRFWKAWQDGLRDSFAAEVSGGAEGGAGAGGEDRGGGDGRAAGPASRGGAPYPHENPIIDSWDQSY